MRFICYALVLASISACGAGSRSTFTHPVSGSPEKPELSATSSPLVRPTIVPTLLPIPSLTAVPSNPEGIVQVEVGEFFFEPQNLVIPVGTKVEWVPVGMHVHTIDSKKGNLEFHGNVGTKGGHTFQLTFQQPGTMLYECLTHPGVMDGVIIVKE